MKRELVCIVCPNGCELTIEEKDGKLSVEGALCKRGVAYAENETTNPVRTIAPSAFIENGEFPLASVRLNRPVPKGRIFDVMEKIKAVKLHAPVHIGQVVIENVCGCDSDVIVTKNVGVKFPSC